MLKPTKAQLQVVEILRHGGRYWYETPGAHELEKGDSKYKNLDMLPRATAATADAMVRKGILKKVEVQAPRFRGGRVLMWGVYEYHLTEEWK